MFNQNSSIFKGQLKDINILPKAKKLVCAFKSKSAVDVMMIFIFSNIQKQTILKGFYRYYCVHIEQSCPECDVQN